MRNPKGRKQLRQVAIAALLISSMAGAAEASETDNLELTVVVTNTTSCTVTIPPQLTTSWYMSAQPTDTVDASVDNATNSSPVNNDIVLNWNSGQDSCLNVVRADGVVETSVVTNGSNLVIMMDCELLDPPCAVNDTDAMPDMLIPFSVEVPAGTSSGNHTVNINVTWVPVA